MSEISDNEIELEAKVSARTRAAVDKGRENIRQRSIERGLVQFRADAQFMEALYKVSDERKIPAGVLCRDWVWQKLQEQGVKAQSVTTVEFLRDDQSRNATVSESSLSYQMNPGFINSRAAFAARVNELTQQIASLAIASELTNSKQPSTFDSIGAERAPTLSVDSLSQMIDDLVSLKAALCAKATDE
jgi:hypothetical protein